MYWRPLHGRPLDAVKRADVAARLQELTKALRPHGGGAGRATYLSALFAWSMREGLCESNPVIGTNDPAAQASCRATGFCPT